MTDASNAVPDPQDEAVQDALDELNRMDSADDFHVKDVDPLALPMIPSVVDHTRRRTVDSMDDGAPIGEGNFRTLEDLYAEFRDIGGGTRFLRVHRRQPSTWNGLRIAGFLADLHEQLGMNEFAARFGGGQYEVSVMGSVPNTFDESGGQRIRSLRSIRIEVPGRPIAVQPQTPQTGSGTGRRGSMMESDQANAQVEIAKINAQQRQQERSEQEKRALMDALVRAKNTPTEVFGQLDALAEKRANDVRAGLQESLASMKREADRLRLQLDEREKAITVMRAERDEAINKLRMELIETRQIAQRDASEREEKRVREVKERFDEEMRRVRDDQAKALQKLAEDHAAATGQLNHNNALERDRLRDDAQRRETQIAMDSKMREEFAERSHRDRIESMEKAFSREIESIRLSMTQQIESIRSSESSKTSLAERTTQVQLSALQQELARKDAELERFRSENDVLRTKLVKTPVEAIQEAHMLASMTGMIPAAEAAMGGEPKGEDEDFDWKKGLIQLAKGAVEKIPETLQRIEQVRAQNQNGSVAAQQQAMAAQQAAYAQHVARQQQAQAQAQAQAGARPLPPGYQQAPVQRRPPPPGFVDAGPVSGLPSAPGEASYVPAVTYGQPIQAPTVPAVRRPMPGQEPEQRVQEARQQIDPNTQGAPQQGAPPVEPPASTVPAQNPAQAVDITPEQVQEIVDNLEAAVTTGVVTPESFAEKFVERVGKPAAMAIVSNLTPDQLVEQVAEGKDTGSTPLATLRGKQFLGKLWAETRKIAVQ